jgi:hypothetical protein
LLTSVAAFSTKEETVATSIVRSLTSVFETALAPVTTVANDGPSGSFLFIDPALARCWPGAGDASLKTANGFGDRNILFGDCIFSAALALIGAGILPWIGNNLFSECEKTNYFPIEQPINKLDRARLFPSPSLL